MRLGKSITGSWYDPAQPGHGIIVHADKILIAYWFSYLFDGGQAWYVAQSTQNWKVDELTLDLLAPTGKFPAIDSENGDPVGTITLSKPSRTKVVMKYQFLNDHQGCKAVDFSPRNPNCGGEFEFARLT